MPQGTAWAKIRPKIAPEDRNVIKEHRDIFWKYIAERLKILERKQNLDKPPWTDDPILQRHHFTNVYRMDDRGTTWLMSNIDTEFWDEKIWRVVQYRWPNYHTYFEKYGWIDRGFNRKKVLKRLNRFRKRGEQWHTSAHIVLQSNFKQTRMENYVHYLGLLDEKFESFGDGIINAKSMEEAFKHVKKFQGLGGFTAYEVLVDLCYLGVVPNSWRDEFANAGPGCQQGIALIYPSMARDHQWARAMVRLRDNQEKAFDRLGLAPPPQRLTLQDIEFNLCEVSKYIKIQYGTGRSRLYRGGK